MNLTTAPAEVTSCSGEINLISTKYFPNEDNRIFKIQAVHGPKYSRVCNSCQAGVTYIKQAFDYLNNGFVVWNVDIIDQTKERVEVLVGDRQYRRSFNLTKQKVCVLPVEPTLENLARWFVVQFKGQLELAHINVFNMQCEDENVSMTLGY